MPRVKRGVIANKTRRKILGYTKGFRWGRKSKERAAREALVHAWSHAFRGRKEKKRTFRSQWQVQINAALRPESLKYSQFIFNLKNKGVALNRKILAELANTDPKVFKAIVSQIRS